MGRITKYTTRFILLLLFFTAATPLFSQQFYPVHATVQVLPPHGLYLSDYYSGTRDRLVVTLFNRDFDRPFLNVRLRVTIRNGNHFMLRSRDELPAPVITLTPGVPLRLTGADLAPYLMPNRVTIQGHLRNGMLPTGDTEFIVQVLDHATGRVLSQAATGRAWLELHQPPQLNLPEQGTSVMFRTPQHIRFQWFPRHIPIAQTVYEFTLRELPDNDVPPQTAFMFGNTIYQTTTRFTTLNLTHLQPLLEPGRRYAWQIRAITVDGIDEIGTFANHGFSEIGWFRLLENCPPPMRVRAEAAGNRGMTIRWQSYHGHQSFIVQYRVNSQQGYEVFPWHTVEVFGNETTISGLRPEWSYLYRVGALCGNMREPVFSEIGQITLPRHDPALLALCGQPHVPRPELENREPLLDDLRPGDVIYVGGGRPMVLTEVTSLGNGWFSGRGITTVIFLLNEIDFYSEFDRLLINTYRFQIGGTANVVRCADGGQIADLTRPQMPQGGGIVFEVVQLDFTVPPMPEMTFNPETGVLAINGIPNTIQVPKNEQGESVFPLEIIDAEGNRFLVELPEDVQPNADGTITPRVTRIEDDEDLGYLDAVIIQGFADGFEVVINDNTYQTTTDRSLRLVYTDDTISMELRRSDDEVIDAADIRWQVSTRTGLLRRRETETTYSTLTKEITIADRDVDVVISKRTTDERGREQFAKIADFGFVVGQSPYITFSTLPNYDGEFGFDDGRDFRENSVPKLSGLYRTFTIAGRRGESRDLFVPWLTLLQGQEAELRANLSREIDGDIITARPSDNCLTVRFDQQQGRVFVRSNTLNNDFSRPAYVNFYRTDRYGLQTDMLIGRIAVVSRPRFTQIIDVQVVYFATDTVNVRHTIDRARLQTLLNSNSMNQAFVQFNVRPNVIRLQNTLSDTHRRDYITAHRRIRTLCYLQGMNITWNHRPTTVYVVLTDVVFSGSNVGGGVIRRTDGYSYNFAVMWSIDFSREDKEKIIIHEIGHTLGLRDVFRDAQLGGNPNATRPPSTSLTRSNYMDYFVRTRNMFFRSQIETIINNLE